MNHVLVIGDPHFKQTNIIECVEATDKLVALAQSIQPTFIVCLGDTLHRHETIHVEPLIKAVSLFRQLSEIAHTYVIIGNHDRPNNSDFLTDKHPFNALKWWNNLTVVDTTIMVNHNNQNFILVPYVSPGRLEEAMSRVVNVNADELNMITAVFAHQEIYGAKMGAITSLAGDKWPLNYPLLVSGHIHDYDQLQPNMIYVGALMQHAFGDRSDKTVSVFTFEQESWNENRIDLGLKKREIVYLTPQTINKFVPDANKLIKVVIRADDADIKLLLKSDKIAELKRLGVKIAFKTIMTDGGNMSEISNRPIEPYLVRLKREIQDDIDQVKWFHTIFGQM